MMNRIKFLFSLLFVSLFLMSADVMAKEEIVVSGPDEEGTYTYTFGDGQFESNLKAGDKAELGIITYNDKLTVNILYNGENISYQSGDLLYITGDYMALIYCKSSGEFTSFSFSIYNDLTSNSTSTNNIFSSNANETFGEMPNDAQNYMDMQSMFDNFETDIVPIADMDFYYYQPEDCYVYSASGNDIFASNIPNNMIATNPVVVRPVKNNFQYVYKDGEIINTPNNYTYTEPGFYQVISYIYSDNYDEIASSYKTYEADFSFRIVNYKNNSLGVVSAPKDFYISSVKYNNKVVTDFDPECVFAESDGKYDIQLKCDREGTVYNLSFERDTVAPFLYFNQEIVSAKADAPVSYSVSENGVEVELRIGGTEIKLEPNTEIYNGGFYVFTASDEAGNERIYRFYVKEHFKFFSKGMINIIIFSLFVAILYVLYVRINSKHI